MLKFLSYENDLPRVQVVALRGLLTSLLFAAFNKLLDFNVIPFLPQPKRTNKNNIGRWRTSVVAFTNSVVTHVLCLISIPALWSDLVNNQSPLGEMVLSSVTGYAIYDSINHLRYSDPAQVWSCLIHHCVMAVVASSLVIQQRCIGYGVWCAIVEGNAIYFHIRDFILAHDFPKSSFLFRLNRTLYTITFALIRVPILIATLVFLWLDRDRMPPFYYYFYTIMDTIMILLNTRTFNKLAVKEKCE